MSIDEFSNNDKIAFKIQPEVFDEVIDVIDAEEIRSPTSSSLKIKDRFSPGPSDSSESRARIRSEAGAGPSSKARSGSNSQIHSLRAIASRHGSMQSDNSDDDDDDDDDDDVQLQTAAMDGSYDPAEYDHLPVNGEIKELFQHIRRYTPQTVELEYRLRPFVPDFIPAVGDIDAFLKVGRPDGQVESVGLTVLDEPCADQSEPAVLHLQLRSVGKQSSDKTVIVKKIENMEKSGKSIDRWIKDISNLHSTKPPPTVHYTRPMPNIDGLMQEWPADFEMQLQEIGLPTPDLDCDITTYVDIMCNLFDIPTYDSKIQALHVLFTLYSAVKNSQHPNNNSAVDGITSPQDEELLPSRNVDIARRNVPKEI